MCYPEKDGKAVHKFFVHDWPGLAQGHSSHTKISPPSQNIYGKKKQVQSIRGDDV